MGYLFLDIESFVDPMDDRSGLNPFHTKSKVIVIAYNYYSGTMYPLPQQIKPPIFLFEWEIGSEKALLKKFYSVLFEINQQDRFLKIIGFNHMAYDLNYMFARMSKHKIAPQKELFNNIYSLPRHVDLAQLGMVFSEKTKLEQDFRTISQKNINAYFSIPVKEASGKDVSIFYEKREYDKIRKYCTEEFTFELLYNSILEEFLSKNK